MSGVEINFGSYLTEAINMRLRGIKYKIKCCNYVGFTFVSCTNANT